MGTHSLDIAVLSDVQYFDEEYKSEARVLLQRITIDGSILGGAARCVKCPQGLISHGFTSFCQACPLGHHPNPA